MLKSIKKFINIPIISLQDGKKIGHAKDFIVDPATGSIIGVVVDKKGVIFKKYLIIPGIDVREISERAVVVDSKKAIIPQKDVVNIDMILKSKLNIISSKVITQEGLYKGKVYDYAVDDFFNIAKLYVNPPVSNIFINQFIIDSRDIIDIRKGVIIIEENNKVLEAEESGVI
ncbi:hypothetical protein HGB13_03400 [bacterium]|nr:hypothetical protein [bacterium]